MKAGALTSDVPLKHFVGATLASLSSLILLTVFSTEVNAQQISQIPQFLLQQEGKNFTTYCNSSSTFYSLQWYKQSPGGSPVLLMILAKAGEDGRFNATTIPKERRSSLHISSSQTTDSGTYFCAAQHSAPQAPAASTQTLRGAQPLLQPQSHREATTGHLQC
uniref:Uncharacterized protein n=1 Tax=Ovis aries TaxID=9940 RepID=A0AC11CZ90_SHEEP